MTHKGGESTENKPRERTSGANEDECRKAGKETIREETAKKNTPNVRKDHPGCQVNFRRRPTLPLSFPSSTIGAKELNFRVRDGNGCDLYAIATEKLQILVSLDQFVCKHAWIGLVV
jgi:hypothetical protein